MIAHRLDHLIAHAIGGAQPELLRQFVEHIDGASFGVGELGGVGHDGRQHLFEVEGRVDGLRHLAERAQLGDRLRQLAGALLDLVLQVGVGFLEPRAHVVELVGETFELVAGLDRDALGEIAAADPGRARPQRLDRDHHAPRQEHPGQHGEHQRGKQHIDQPVERFVERRVGFLDRKLDEHPPAERLDRRRRGQHLAALDVLRHLQMFAGVARRGSACGAHMRKSRHVGVAQHQADVGMRDQACLPVDHVGAAFFADLDLRHHVPNQLEVDLRDAHAGVAPRAGERQRHVRLGLAAEVDRAVVDLVGRGFGELRLLGEVDAAADHVHGEPRDAQPLLARGIDLRQFGDRGHLTQQPQRVEPALLDRARRPRQLRRPAELAFDFLDELADLGRRRFRLFALDADQRCFVLLVVEIDLENAVGNQRDADHQDEQPDVFGEQPAADPGRRTGRRRS